MRLIIAISVGLEQASAGRLSGGDDCTICPIFGTGCVFLVLGRWFRSVVATSRNTLTWLHVYFEEVEPKDRTPKEMNFLFDE